MITQDVEQNSDPGTATLLRNILADGQTLLNQHVTLLRQELQGKVLKIQKALLPLVMGMVSVVVAGVILSVAAALLLHELVPQFPAWACFGLLGVFWACATGGLLLAARTEFNSVQAVPEKSLQGLKEDMRCLMKN